MTTSFSLAATFAFVSISSFSASFLHQDFPQDQKHRGSLYYSVDSGDFFTSTEFVPPFFHSTNPRYVRIDLQRAYPCTLSFAQKEQDFRQGWHSLVNQLAVDGFALDSCDEKLALVSVIAGCLERKPATFQQIKSAVFWEIMSPFSPFWSFPLGQHQRKKIKKLLELLPILISHLLLE